MVEVASDKDGILPLYWTAGEREAWYYMCNKFGLFDPNTNRRQGSGVWHTWSNFQAGSDHILKCLDCAMISMQYFFSFFEDRDFCVIPLSDVMLSDHFPIYFGITWQTTVPKVAKSQFFLNTSVLMHASTISHIQHVWHLEPCPHSKGMDSMVE